jgi:hypothetical protein
MWQYLLTHTPLFYFVQSFWRDEAFSVLMAEKSVLFILKNSGLEPPVYYLLLHFWMKIFGEGEIAVRSLSFIGFSLATYIVIEWSDIAYPKHWMNKFLPIFFFLNPMLLYYAFEVRTYGWYTFFATAALYTYTTKKWRLFVVASVLAFYTHVYFLPFMAAFVLHWVVTNKRVLRSVGSVIHNETIRAFVIIGICYIPWILKALSEFGRLKQSWYFPVNFQLVRSVLGNMFLGYEGTPWYGWFYTGILSLCIFVFFIHSVIPSKTRKQNLLYIIICIVPLCVVIGVSFIKPLFVNRYMIPATVAEILAITSGIYAIKNKYIQRIAAAICLLFVVWFNWWYPQEHPKLPIRATITQINMLLGKNDVIYATSPLIFLETKYYAKDRSRVFFYNISDNPFPWYIGDTVVTKHDIISTLPTYPTKAYMIKEDATFEIQYKTNL